MTVRGGDSFGGDSFRGDSFRPDVLRVTGPDLKVSP